MYEASSQKNSNNLSRQIFTDMTDYLISFAKNVQVQLGRDTIKPDNLVPLASATTRCVFRFPIKRGLTRRPRNAPLTF